MKRFAALLRATALAASTATADAPLVAPLVAGITQSNGSFSVTLSHPDTGWDHNADG